MNNDLVSKVGDSPVDNLVNSTFPPPLTTGVIVRAGQGKLQRGAVLALSSDSGEMVILGTAAAEDETLTASVILADPVDASGSAAVPAIAYRTGHFNRPALIAKTGYAITRADEENLRFGGILLSDALA